MVDTLKQYKTYLNKFALFAQDKGVDPSKHTTCILLDFLLSVFQQGYSYSSINTARSAVSALTVPSNQPPIGSNPLMQRFMKAEYNARPALPCYQCIWDVDCVLDYL